MVDGTNSHNPFPPIGLGYEGLDTVHGHRFIDSAEVVVGGVRTQLFSITERSVDAESLVEQSEVGAQDRALAPEAARLLGYYPHETWLVHNTDTDTVPLPFVPVELYLDNPSRVADMVVELESEPFQLNPSLQPFKDRLIAEQLAAGRNVTNGENTVVAAFDPARNVMRLRKAGYFDMFTTQNFGADLPLGETLTINGQSGSTIRELAGDGRLPQIGEDSLVTNSLGLGGVMKTGDGKLLLCRRRGNLGVGSASGTFGFSAAGNLAWGDALREELDNYPAHEAIALQGIAKEVREELGLAARFGWHPGDIMTESISRMVERDLGLRSGECNVLPIGIMRDATHMGHPQTAYFLETALTAEQVISRMLHAEDSRKEYDIVLAIDTDRANIDRVIRNEASSVGINFNAEIRATLALMLSQENGQTLLTHTG